MSEENKAVETLAGTQVTFIIPDTESLGRLDELEPQFNLTMKYRSTDDWAVLKDKPIRCFFMGMKPIPNENGELVNCGVFVSKTECFISGQMLLVDAVSNLSAGTPIEVTYVGKTKNKNSDGQTCNFLVSKLG